MGRVDPCPGLDHAQTVEVGGFMLQHIIAPKITFSLTKYMYIIQIVLYRVPLYDPKSGHKREVFRAIFCLQARPSLSSTC